MDVEYKKDLHHNYMVITEKENSKAEKFCIKMLSIVSIEGLLKMDRRTIDNQVLYYYDISAKQSIHILLDKSVLSYEIVKQLFSRIIITIEKAYEYLLLEDDFVLTPEFIYMEVTTDTPYLCYLSGYQKNIKDQISSFIEYIMNKVDYNDKEAVLLIYSLYAASKEAGFTFGRLQEALQKQNNPVQITKWKGSEEESCGEMLTGGISKKKELKEKELEEKVWKEKNLNGKEKAIIKPVIPVMMEKLVGEEEVACFPIKTYLLTAACILGGVLVLALGILTKAIYNSFGNRIDYSKLFALILLVLCVIGYLLRKIWDKKNQITKIITKQEYINPSIVNDYVNMQSTNQEERIKDEKVASKASIELLSREDEEKDDYNPTCILNQNLESSFFILKSINTAQYEDILITQFPFFIGKLKKNVDYCLEKDTVSRYHAKITKEQEGYYITDLNSTNGTFLNKESLQTYQKEKIKQGDEIAFANIKFLFIMQEE